MSWSYSHSITISSASRQTGAIACELFMECKKLGRETDEKSKGQVGLTNLTPWKHTTFLLFTWGLCRRCLTCSGKSMCLRINGPCPWFRACYLLALCPWASLFLSLGLVSLFGKCQSHKVILKIIKRELGNILFQVGLIVRRLFPVVTVWSCLTCSWLPLLRDDHHLDI